MDETYSKLLSCLLLREVFGHLPERDQLTMRKVNKDWEDEARYAIRENPRQKINIFTEKLMDQYLALYDPPSEPMRLLPLVNIRMYAGIPAQKLEIFGQNHGEYIRKLAVSITWTYFVASVATLLNNCPNLEELRILQRICLGFDGQLLPGCRRYIPPDPEPVTLGPLPKLHHLEFETEISKISFLHEIVSNAPALKTICLNLVDDDDDEDADVDPLMTDLFNKLKNLRMDTLAFAFSIANPDHGNSLLGELLRSELKPKTLFINSYINENGDIPTEIGKNLLKKLIEKFGRTGQLDKIKIENRYKDDVSLYFPEQMPWLKHLYLGGGPRAFARYSTFVTKLVHPAAPLTPAQVPNLDTLVYSQGTPLDEAHVFVNMRKLVVECTQWIITPISAPLPSAVKWHAQYPNLKVLDTCLIRGQEDFLDPILTKMVNLTEFTLRCVCTEKRMPAEPLWDKMTGGLKPMLHKASPLRSIIPTNVPVEQEVLLEGGDTQGPIVPSLQNLRNLKILNLMNISSVIVVAIVHLTATQKIPALLKLEVTLDSDECNERFIPPQAWIDVLKRFHANVEI